MGRVISGEGGCLDGLFFVSERVSHSLLLAAAGSVVGEGHHSGTQLESYRRFSGGEGREAHGGG